MLIYKHRFFSLTALANENYGLAKQE